MAATAAARTSKVHPRSLFDVSANLYDRARPSYPLHFVDKMIRSVSNQNDIRAMDLACGSGIFSRLMLPYPHIKEILAVDPSAGMRATYQTSVIDELKNLPSPPKVSLHDGNFYDIPAEDQSIDLIVIAQAWHWVGDKAEDHNAAMTELARVLKPKGILAWIWNLEDQDAAAEWVRPVRDVYEKYEGGSPQYRLGLWKPTLETEAFERRFQHPFTGAAAQPDVTKDERQIPTSDQGVVDRVFSKSYIQILSDEEREEVRKEVMNVLNQSEKQWIDQKAGTYEYPYKTDMYLMRRN